MNLLYTKLRNRIKANCVDKLQLIYINSWVFKRANGKRLEPNRTLLNLTLNQEIELKDEHLPPSPTSFNIFGKRSKDSEYEEEDYLLNSAQSAPACRHNFLHDVL